jgi:hypothetical protein
MQELEGHYQVALHRPSDINGHIQTLRQYAKECTHIMECGVRTCVSSWAFLHGLVNSNNSSPKTLIGLDLDFHPNINDVNRVARSLGVEYSFYKGNDLNVEMKQTDLLFIDTWHVYAQLKRELEKMHPFVNKYIILHDTEVDGELGESIRLGFDIPAQVKNTGFPEEEIRKGLRPAIEEFLAQHPEWYIKEQFTHNNGLTILAKKA